MRTPLRDCPPRSPGRETPERAPDSRLDPSGGDIPADPDIVAAFRLRGEPNRGSGDRAGAGRLDGGLRRGCSVVICTYERASSLMRCLDSLRKQTLRPDQVLIVDASQDARTEAAVRGDERLGDIASGVSYFRVSGRFRGLTRQRNFALERAAYDLVAFFDDDTVLDPSCLAEMERIHRLLADRVAGAGAMISNASPKPDLAWRLRRGLRVVPDLRPGSYTRSGFSLPWSFLGSRGGLAEGDWLPGCAMMWRTDFAREVGFHEGFAGYAHGEDLDFSLRMRRRGRLVMVCGARVEHLLESSGRPDDFKLGYMAIFNKYEIHRRGLPERGPRDVAWFIYAWTIDTLMLARHFFFPRRWVPTVKQVAGRGKAALDLMRGRQETSANRGHERRSGVRV